MTRKLTVAVGAYDRTLPLMAGLVKIDGVDAHFVTAPLEEIFARAFDEHAYDVTELSASNYIYLTATGTCPYVALPIYPSRAFRHSAVYIRTDRGIREPRDLAGRLVGVREYSMTAALVARGVLEDEYGLAARDVRWRYGPADTKDAPPIVRVRPRGVELEPLDAPDNLSDALAEGTIDALVAYKPPRVLCRGAPPGAPSVRGLSHRRAGLWAAHGRRPDHALHRRSPRDRGDGAGAVPRDLPRVRSGTPLCRRASVGDAGAVHAAALGRG